MVICIEITQDQVLGGSNSQSTASELITRLKVILLTEQHSAVS